MSLEIALEKNTAAIEKLIAILQPLEHTSVTVHPHPPAEIDPLKTKRAKKEAKPEAPAGEFSENTGPQAEQTAPSPAAGAPDAPATVGAATATKELTYADAAAAVTALINSNGRDAALALLKRFGATNLKGVDPARYGELIEAARDEAVPF